jgi:uncharacterized membrane protein YphA (DoxX/SURF4 family)
MGMRRAVVLGVAYLAATISGLSKQIEMPQLVDTFEHAGLPGELLSLFGAVEFVLALALLFPRTRRPAAVLLAGMFGAAAYLMWPQGMGPALAFNTAMVPLVLLAGLWQGGAFARREPYMGAMHLDFSKPRR